MFLANAHKPKFGLKFLANIYFRTGRNLVYKEWHVNGIIGNGILSKMLLDFLLFETSVRIAQNFQGEVSLDVAGD